MKFSLALVLSLVSLTSFAQRANRQGDGPGNLHEIECYNGFLAGMTEGESELTVKVKVRPLNRGARVATVSPRLAEVIGADVAVYGVSLEMKFSGDSSELDLTNQTVEGQVTQWMPVSGLSTNLRNILANEEESLPADAVQARLFVDNEGSYWTETKTARNRYEGSLPWGFACGREKVRAMRREIREYLRQKEREEREMRAQEERDRRAFENGTLYGP